MSAKYVVIFGGSGFIGTALCRQLAKQGVKRILSADLNPPRVELPGLEYVRVDVRNGVQLDSPTPDIVFNLAAIHRTPGHEPDEYFETNVLGALNVCRYSEARKVRKLVFSSSISVYGPSEDLTTEATPLAPTTSYGRSKLMAEMIHRRWNESSVGHLVIVRPAVIFGPGEGGNFDRLNRAILRHRFVFPGRRDTIKSCGYVDELIWSMLWALQQDQKEVTYNFAYPERTTIEKIVNTIAIQNSVKSPTLIIPYSLVKTLQRISPLAGLNFSARVKKLTESTNVFPGFLSNHGYEFATNLESGIASWLSSLPYEEEIAHRTKESSE